MSIYFRTFASEKKQRLKIMKKAIQIKFEGMVKLHFSSIRETDWRGNCYLSEKAEDFIKSQSIDGKIYLDEPCENVMAYGNGSIARYYIKGNVYDETSLMPKEGEWAWKWVELEVINLKDDEEKDESSKRELYERVSEVLTWYENPEEYPCGEDEFNRHISEEMYKILCRVQNELFPH